MKRKEKNKKKELILTVIALIGLVVITVGISYAFFNYTKEGTTDNVITTGTITFLYTEVDKIGKGISISDAFPMSDELGKNQTGDNKVFNFKITSTTTSKNSIPYEITARKDSESTLDESVVKMYLTKVEGDNEQQVLLKNYKDLDQTDKVDSKKYTEKVLHSDRVPSHQENYEQEYRLRMWIDEDTDFSQKDDESYPYNNKTFTVTVNVYAEGKVITEEDKELESNVNIKSIKVGENILEKLENKEYEYETVLEDGTTETEIQVETENPYAKVKIEKVDSLAYQSSFNVRKLSTSNKVPLSKGDNYFKVIVTSEDGNQVNESKLNIRVLEFFAVFNQKYPVIDKQPTLTNSSNNTNDENGLYKSTKTNDERPTYYFRGNVINNYVSFAGQIWRVVRINEDGSIRMIMQTGINSTIKYTFSPDMHNSMYYSESNVTNGAKKILDEWYQTNIVAKGLDSKVLTEEYCEQAKVAYDSSFAARSGVDMQPYTDYSPNFKCINDTQKKGPLQLKIGLITYDEVVYAGAYNAQSNSSYYLYNGNSFWTMSPGGISEWYSSDWGAYTSGSIGCSALTDKFLLRPVINLANDITVTGIGTTDQPWVVQ